MVETTAIDVDMDQTTTIDLDMKQKTTAIDMEKQKAAPSETTPKKRKAAASSSEPEPEPESKIKDDLFPVLYLLLGESSHEYSWHSLDLKLGKPALMGWKSDFYCDSVALSLKSEIYLLGGVHVQPPPLDRDAFFGWAVTRFRCTSDHVHRLDTAKASTNSNFTLVTSIPTKPSTNCNCAALSDKIYVFHILNANKPVDHLDIKTMSLYPFEPKHVRFDRADHQIVLEVYNPSSNKWDSYTEVQLQLPNELKGIDPDNPVLSDSLNNRILAYYPTQGVYSFQPDNFKWEHLSSERFEFLDSAVINGVLYTTRRCGDIRMVVAAFDLDNRLQPLRMVWPRPLPHQNKKKIYQFGHDVKWMSPIDLGNGMLCLLYHDLESIDPARRRKCGLYSYSDSDSDSYSEQFYCSSEDDVAPPDVAPPEETEDNSVVVLKGMILEVEKIAGSKGTMKLRVKKAARVRYELDHFSPSQFSILNIVTIARP